MPFRDLFSSVFSGRRRSSHRDDSTRHGASSRYETPGYSSTYDPYQTPSSSRVYSRRAATRAANRDYGPVDIGTLGGSAYESYGSSSRSRSTRQARREASRAAREDGPVDYGTLGGSAYGTASRSDSTRRARREATRAARNYENVDIGTMGGSAYDPPSHAHDSSRTRRASPGATSRYGESSHYGFTGGDRLAQEAARRRGNVSPLGTSRFEQPYSGRTKGGSYARGGSSWEGHGGSYEYY